MITSRPFRSEDFVTMVNVRCQACQAKYRLLAAKRVNLLGLVLEARPQKPAPRFPYRPPIQRRPRSYIIQPDSLVCFSSSSSFVSFSVKRNKRPFVLCAGKANAGIVPKTLFSSRLSARLAGLRIGLNESLRDDAEERPSLSARWLLYVR